MVQVRIETRDVEQQLDRLTQLMRNPRRIYRRVEKMMLAAVASNFSEGGRPDKWEPRKKSYSWPILDKTGALKGSIKARVLTQGVELESGLPYSAAHQFGYAAKNLPARPYMVLTDSDVDDIADDLDDQLERAANSGR